MAEGGRTIVKILLPVFSTDPSTALSAEDPGKQEKSDR